MNRDVVMSISGLEKSFGGLKAIDDVSLEVLRGQCFGIIGANGAGKTTLINLVTGYLRPDKGTVVLEGEDVTGAPPYALASRGVGRTFQIVQPFGEMSVLDNVMTGALFSPLGRRRSLSEARAFCEEPLALVGLTAQAQIPASALTLSGKKLELARVLATQPRIILLDEVMGGLSRHEIDDVVDVLERINDSGVTIMMIEHLVPVITYLCDHVYVMNFGRELFQGTASDVVGHPEVIHAYLGKPPQEAAAPAPDGPSGAATLP